MAEESDHGFSILKKPYSADGFIGIFGRYQAEATADARRRNCKLKRLLPNTKIDNAGLKDLMLKSVAYASKRNEVVHLPKTLSKRRVWAVVGGSQARAVIVCAGLIMASCAFGIL